MHPEREERRRGEVQNDDDSSPFQIAAGTVFKFTSQCEGGRAQDRGPEDLAAAVVAYGAYLPKIQSLANKVLARRLPLASVFMGW